jgi:thiosulfate/3-mercaptopyruvate sulfurtransferase
MLLNGGQWNGKRLLREETVRAMRSNQIRDLSIGTPGQKFGLGFAVAEKAEDQGQQLVGSYAWGGFFGTLFWIVPKEDWILVVMLQQVGGPEPSRRWPNELIRLAAAAVGKSPNQPPSQAMLIEPETLQAHLHQPGLRLLDTRPKAEYLKGHIPGATWVDVKRWQQLGCKEGGLRDALAWGKEVGGLGIKGDSAVVVYGSTPPDTARIWWTLKYLGVKNVSILNGGWPLWIKEKRLTDTISPVVQAAKFEPKFQSDLLEEADSLKKSLGTGRVTVVDARSKEEFTGQEVRGKRGGHIPGARHLEWKDLLAADGRFKSPEQLRALFQQRGIHPKQTAVTC